MGCEFIRLVWEEFGGGVGVVLLVVAGERWLVVLMFTLLFRLVPKPRVFSRLLTDSIGRKRDNRRGGEVATKAGADEDAEF